MNVTLHGVTVAFGTTLALDDVDLDVTDGVAGVFGPNGSGKSTLLRVIAGLIRPIEGTVALDGVEVSRRDEDLRRKIGYAGHESGLYPRLSLFENLHLFATLYGVRPDGVEHVVRDLRLDDVAARPVRELSAGTKRRAAVARALVHDPELLLLDEPYANVDDDAAEAISETIARWRGDRKTALVATHGAKKVRAYADQGVVLQRGHLVRVGRYTETGFSAT